MATPNAKPKPKEDPASISAQNQRLTLLQAVTAFRTKIADSRLLSEGQFTWAIRYREELRDKVRNVLAQHPGLSNRWLPQNGFMDRFTDTFREKDPKSFNALVNEALGVPEMADGSTEAKTMRQLLKASDVGGKIVHDRAMKFLRQGTPVVKGSAAFDKTYTQDVLTLPGARDIRRHATDRCFEMTNAVCDFIATKKGLNGRSGPASNPDILFDSPAIQRKVDPAFGDLVRYGADLKKRIAKAKQMLDHGHLLSTNVVSGILLDNSVTNGDHFLPLLAWEEFLSPIPHVVFAFWDPDATQSTDPQFGKGFGRVFFVNGSDAQSEAPPTPALPANFYRNGRLTTALRVAELRVGSDGDQINNGQHRYQILSMIAH